MEHIGTHISEILILLFIAITFLQSGIDKMVDWSGNVGWLKGHFSKTFLAGQVPMMLAIILILEVVSGVLALIGIAQIMLYDVLDFGLYSSVLGAITLLMLLFGQRVAKDYAGAFTIVGYFIVVIFGVYIMS